jgi:hypothetical protein
VRQWLEITGRSVQIDDESGASTLSELSTCVNDGDTVTDVQRLLLAQLEGMSRPYALVLAGAIMEVRRQKPAPEQVSRTAVFLQCFVW